MTAFVPPGDPHQGRRASSKLVIIAPVLPFDGITHAGGLYLQTLQRALDAARAQVTYLVDGSNYWAVDRPGAPERVVLLGVPLKRTPLGRVSARGVREVERLLRRWYPTWPRLPFALHLMVSPAARAALREADVVDLHWPETTHLVRWVRLVNPRARVIATLHDVLSQRWTRQAQSGVPGREGWARSLAAARRLESAILRHADMVIVFSDKDRELLRPLGGPRVSDVRVVAPPLATSDVRPRTPDCASPAVVFVGLLDRPENGEAAIHLIRHIWPSVIERVPTARLRIVGAGGSHELHAACAATMAVELTGFVPDLAAEYAAASACVVPLTRGAGVKFKTVEALIAGVPTVTTKVGAEGVAGPEHFAAVEDDPQRMADALVEILEDPDTAEAAASASQRWARDHFDVVHFRRTIRKLYGLARAD